MSERECTDRDSLSQIHPQTILSWTSHQQTLLRPWIDEKIGKYTHYTQNLHVGTGIIQLLVSGVWTTKFGIKLAQSAQDRDGAGNKEQSLTSFLSRGPGPRLCSPDRLDQGYLAVLTNGQSCSGGKYAASRVPTIGQHCGTGGPGYQGLKRNPVF